MKPPKSYKTNNHFSTAFHATRLRPLHLVDLDDLEAELEFNDEDDWDSSLVAQAPPPVGRVKGYRAA